MNESALIATLATVFAVAGSAGLYAASPNQSWRARRPPFVPTLAASLIALAIGLALFVAAWGITVATLLTLSVWMVVSVALPYLAAWRTTP